MCMTSGRSNSAVARDASTAVAHAAPLLGLLLDAWPLLKPVAHLLCWQLVTSASVAIIIVLSGTISGQMSCVCLLKMVSRYRRKFLLAIYAMAVLTAYNIGLLTILLKSVEDIFIV